MHTGLYIRYCFFCFVAITLAACQSANKVQSGKDGWVSLFNGRDINDWMVKINHHEVGDNFGNTFRVEDSMIKVRYDQYGAYNDQFGHLYYKTPFSYYHLVVEYRLTVNGKKMHLLIQCSTAVSCSIRRIRAPCPRTRIGRSLSSFSYWPV